MRPIAAGCAPFVVLREEIIGSSLIISWPLETPAARGPF
jgi:hypothetical protein